MLWEAFLWRVIKGNNANKMLMSIGPLLSLCRIGRIVGFWMRKRKYHLYVCRSIHIYRRENDTRCNFEKLDLHKVLVRSVCRCCNKGKKNYLDMSRWGEEPHLYQNTYHSGQKTQQGRRRGCLLNARESKYEKEIL